MGAADGRPAFYLTAESPQDQYGWRRSDLSGALVRRDFPKGADVTNFSVAQTTHGGSAGSLRLAMVVRDGAADHLYLSLDNSDHDTTWSKSPNWTACPFDAGDGDLSAGASTLKIVDVFLSEASDNDYIVVDVVRNPQSPVALVSRYFIDVTDPAHPTWNPHDLPFDIEVSKYSTCLGRPDPNTPTERKYPVDGLYTSGSISGESQFIYRPLYDVFDPSAPTAVRRLRLADGDDRIPSAIAACRKPDDTSDLFATADGTLYYFASDNQKDGATAVALLKSPFFVGVTRLFASVANDVVTVWGLNAANQVFQLRCPASEVRTQASWTVPVPVMSAVDSVAPFVNRSSDALTFFAHAGANQLKIAVKSPGPVGTWMLRDVVLPPISSTQPAASFSSYTTRIQVTDAAGRPTARVAVSLATQNQAVTSAYINHLYYVLGQAPVEVETDANGTITIVESVSRLDATRFTASVVGGSDLQVNPMQDSPTVNTKLRTLNTQSGLGEAVIHYQDPAKNPPKKLVKSTADPSDVAAAATNVESLWQAHDALHNPSAVSAEPLEAPDLSAYRRFVGDQTPIPVDAGDLFMMLDANAQQRAALALADPAAAAESGLGESGWDAFVDWFLNLGKKVWRFIVRIGEAIYEAVLDVVEKVYAAFKYVFDKIVEVIEDVIDFVKFLFDVEDMKRTKDVFKNVLKLFLYEQVEQIEVVKGTFDVAANAAIKAIDDWAGIGGFDWVDHTKDSKLPDPSASAFGKTAPETLLSHHYQGNASRADYNPSGSTPPAPSTVLEALELASEEQTAALKKALDQLTKLVQEGEALGALKILTELVGIVGSLALTSSKIVIDALFDVIHIMAKAALDLIDYPIHIPVVSDILNAFGIPDFSFLDILCWIVAVPVTIVYKIAMTVAGRGETSPFPDSPETTFLITVSDFALLERAFGVSTERAALREASLVQAGGSPVTLTHNQKKGVSFLLHAAAALGGAGSAFIDFGEAVTPSKLVSSKLAVAGGASALLGGGSRALANYLVPRCPVKDGRLLVFNVAVTIPFLLNKFFWSTHDYWRPPLELVEDPRKWGARCDAFLALCSMAGSIWHIVELASEEEGWDRSSAILDEISMLFSCCARIGYAALTSGWIEDPDTEFWVDVGMTVANGGFSAFQLAEAGVELISPWE
ncbi:hypothetical protein ACH3VR_01745 [Microbacterium sp. B2969]|uniref:Big-1 domain-containing protein n=1 Tax=Microbacterium alkaliflavum TaxID=3248839 RepID=A0ABW7Q2X4_9MICO